MRGTGQPSAGAALGARTSALRTALRTRLWPLPTAALVVALVLGVVLPDLDARYDDALPGALSARLFGGGGGAARSLLGTMTSSLITVTSLTFSLTVVTLQLASSQFSPRLLRTFTRDRFVHGTLALFLAAFTYALTVLRSVRTSSEDGVTFVPQLAVTLAFVLTLASVLCLVLFLAHLAQEIRVETTMRRVHDESRATAFATLPRRPDAPVPVAPVPPDDVTLLTPSGSGFLIGVDERALLHAAVQADAVLLLDEPVGTFLVSGTPCGRAWRRDGRDLDPAAAVTLRQALQAGLSTGPERTEESDVGLGLRQLTDVVVKALSPGVNDPTTAVHGLGHVAALLCELLERDLGVRQLHDEEGRVRVVLQQRGAAELLDLALAQPRRYGAADPLVLGQLFTVLRQVAWRARDDEQRDAVRGQLRLLRGTVQAQDFAPVEQRRLDDRGAEVEASLDGRWPTQG